MHNAVCLTIDTNALATVFRRHFSEEKSAEERASAEALVRGALEAKWPDATVSVVFDEHYDCDAAGFGTPHDRADIEAEAMRAARDIVRALSVANSAREYAEG